jgi:hypothetical protein
MSAQHHDVSQDKGPAFVGLFVGVILLGAFVYGMVQWTNARFEGHSAGAAAAAETHK